MYPSIPVTIDFITQNDWDILTYLKDKLLIFMLLLFDYLMLLSNNFTG